MKKNIFLSIIVLCFAAGVSAQTNTFYFMDEVPTRHDMNPAFIPNTTWYWNIIFPSFYVEGGNNAFAFKDIIMKNNNEWVTALHSSQNKNKYFNRLPKTTDVGLNLGIDVMNFGFRIKEKNYFTFDLGVKANADIYLPKDIFKLVLFGTPEEEKINPYKFKNIGVNAAVYGELGLGYMRQINDKVNIGVKLKGLVGFMGINSKIKNASLDASRRYWDLTLDGDIYAATPLIYYNTADTALKFKDNIKIKDILTPQGFGGAIDLGVTYEPIKNLVISAAVTDLGFIRWNKPKNITQFSANGTFRFEGVEFKANKDIGESFLNSLDTLVDRLSDAVEYEVKEQGNKFNQWLTANVNVGIEYGILKNKISFGALSNTRINQSRVMEEITVAVNFRPADWFKTYFSYTFFDGRYNNIGWGVNLRMGAVNTFLVLDYIPLSWAKTSNLYENQTKAIPIPYGTQKFNIQAGMTFNFGRNSSDKDRDGVRNRKDKCPDTDINALMSLCPDVKRKDFVDKTGCTKDEDGDGVPDCYDKCPNTPENVPVDEYGCPFDEDGDGVYDHLDKCPGTPKGVEVDANGCPFDEDGDGVYDYLDKCPGTEKGIEVDENGCPKDSDGDGVLDYLDKCPNTPRGVEVDANGCPKDSDGDGVPDYLDKCPGTPKTVNGLVDANGCPKDTDGDGIPDYLDRCPDVPGSASNYGCPEVKQEILKVFKQALNGIQFETGKATIKSSSNAILNQVVKIMQDNPDFNLDIAGHTDNVGNPDMNLDLSKKRAAAVKEYMVKKGVAEGRLKTEGYGDTRPVAPNTTAAGRTQNRRVEFTVIFEKMVKE